MIHHLRQSLLVSCFLAALQVKAQHNTVASGADMQGPGGTVSQSIGQIVYDPLNGTITQGIQQSYEISIETGIDQTAINLSLEMYPNPAADHVVLSVQVEYTGMYYQLTDLQGKLLRQEEIKSEYNSIDLAPYTRGAYLLRVIRDGREQKSFKLIKN